MSSEEIKEIYDIIEVGEKASTFLNSFFRIDKRPKLSIMISTK